MASRVAGDLLDDGVEVDDRAGQAIHGGDDDEVAAADVPNQGGQLRAVASGLPGLLLDEDLVALSDGLELSGRVLVDAGYADVGHALPRERKCLVHVSEPSRDM